MFVASAANTKITTKVKITVAMASGALNTIVSIRRTNVSDLYSSFSNRNMRSEAKPRSRP